MEGTLQPYAPTAIKVPEVTSWIYLSWVKAATSETKEENSALPTNYTYEPLDNLKLLFKRNLQGPFYTSG